MKTGTLVSTMFQVFFLYLSNLSIVELAYTQKENNGEKSKKKFFAQCVRMFLTWPVEYHPLKLLFNHFIWYANVENFKYLKLTMKIQR